MCSVTCGDVHRAGVQTLYIARPSCLYELRLYRGYRFGQNRIVSDRV